MKYLLAISFISLLLLKSCSDNPEATGGSSIEILSENFTDPPNSARPGAFWCWLNGNISKTAITRDLEEMKDKGMSRAEIWDVAAARNADNFIPAGSAFLGDSSVVMIKHALAEGETFCWTWVEVLDEPDVRGVLSALHGREERNNVGVKKQVRSRSIWTLELKMEALWWRMTQPQAC